MIPRLEPRHVDLGDPRLDRRLLKRVDDLARGPESSLPEAAGDWAATKAAYRSFDNPRVGPELIRDAQRRCALERLPDDGPILAIQDTAGLDSTDHPATAGLGDMAHPEHSGLWLHWVLAVTPEGVRRGILDQRAWVRDPAELGKAAGRRSEATTEKASRRWPEALEATEAALPAGRELVTIADREADIYDLLARPRRGGSHLLIRVEPARGVRHPERLLGPAVRGAPAAGARAVELRRRDGRPARRATLTIRYLAPEVAPPADRRGRNAVPYVALTATLAAEEDPPKGEAAVRWWLVTTLPIRGVADAKRMVRRYALRWLIERHHFVLKSGGRVERLQLATRSRPERAVATYPVGAWRLLWLRYQARRHPEQSCERVPAAEGWRVMPRELGEAVGAGPPRLRAAERGVARLGGSLAREGDGEPGVKTIWRGLRRLNDLVRGWRLHKMKISIRPGGNA